MQKFKTVDELINQLKPEKPIYCIRKKFKKVDPDFTAIETRYGSGYRWNVS
ncbi:hypothetical protein N9J79_04235 [Candidatus Pelagibacter ubique]|nr:hypothetical protein [Candidatus Pelagibacter ubique]